MGFLVPNSIDTADIRQSEPDAVDWRIVGDRDNAVLSGFDLTAGSGTQANIDAGTAVVDGVLYEISSGSVTMALGGANDRFDIIGVTSSGLTVQTGTAASEPVFPDIPDTDFLPLYAVIVHSGVETLTSDKYVDKRAFSMDGSRGAADSDEEFLHNLGSDDSTYKVMGDGTTVWGASPDHVTLTPTANKISIDKEVEVEDLSVTGDFSGVDAEFSGNISSSNLGRGTSLPLSGNEGDLFQHTDLGSVYVYKGGDWREIYADEYPVGTVITNIMTPADMAVKDSTWQVMDGTRLVGAGSGGGPENGERLWDIVPASWKDGNDIVLPDMREQYIQGAASTTSVGGSGGSNSKTLTKDNMPVHKHFSSTSTGTSGSHSHSASAQSDGIHSHSVSNSGSHSHTVNDPGHRHMGADHGYDVPTYFVCALWGGTNKLDAHFSDASHTWTVDMSTNTVLANTGITIPKGGSHSHAVSNGGAHTHAVTVSDSSGHTHPLPTETNQGGSVPFDNRPSSLQLNYYIKL